MEIQREVIEALHKAVATRFWGDIKLVWQAGEVITIRTESNQKIKSNIRPNKENPYDKQAQDNRR
jgi:hypothetical protein